MRASTKLEEGAPILVGRHIKYEGAIKFKGAPMHYRGATKDGGRHIKEER